MRLKTRRTWPKGCQCSPKAPSPAASFARHELAKTVTGKFLRRELREKKDVSVEGSASCWFSLTSG